MSWFGLALSQSEEHLIKIYVPWTRNLKSLNKNLRSCWIELSTPRSYRVLGWTASTFCVRKGTSQQMTQVAPESLSTSSRSLMSQPEWPCKLARGLLAACSWSIRCAPNCWISVQVWHAYMLHDRIMCKPPLFLHPTLKSRIREILPFMEYRFEAQDS